MKKEAVGVKIGLESLKKEVLPGNRGQEKPFTRVF